MNKGGTAKAAKRAEHKAEAEASPVPPELAAGLRSAATEPPVDLGSFAEYAEDDAPTADPPPSYDQVAAMAVRLPLEQMKSLVRYLSRRIQAAEQGAAQ